MSHTTDKPKNRPKGPSTLGDLVIKRHNTHNGLTIWVYDEIIAKRVYRGEAGKY